MGASQPANKAALLTLTLFAGGLGAHKFYLGKYWQGILYLLFSWTCIPALVALIEFVVYAFTRNENIQAHTAHTVAGVSVAVIGYVGFGAIGYIAITASQDFHNRAWVAGAMIDMVPARDAVAA